MSTPTATEIRYVLNQIVRAENPNQQWTGRVVRIQPDGLELYGAGWKHFFPFLYWKITIIQQST